MYTYWVTINLLESLLRRWYRQFFFVNPANLTSEKSKHLHGWITNLYQIYTKVIHTSCTTPVRYRRTAHDWLASKRGVGVDTRRSQWWKGVKKERVQFCVRLCTALYCRVIWACSPRGDRSPVETLHSFLSISHDPVMTPTPTPTHVAPPQKSFQTHAFAYT